MSWVFTVSAVGAPGSATLSLVHMPIPPEAVLDAKGSLLHPFPENFLQKQELPGLRSYVPPSPPPQKKTHTGGTLGQCQADSEERRPAPCLEGAQHAPEVPAGSG